MNLPSPNTATDLTVRLEGRCWPFTTSEDVARTYRAAIERLGIGGSATPRCEILDRNGTVVGRVSYNGRVWELCHPEDDRSVDWGVCVCDPFSGQITHRPFRLADAEKDRLAAEYIVKVGCDPFVNDPAATVDEVRKALIDIEAEARRSACATQGL